MEVSSRKSSSKRLGVMIDGVVGGGFEVSERREGRYVEHEFFGRLGGAAERCPHMVHCSAGSRWYDHGGGQRPFSHQALAEARESVTAGDANLGDIRLASRL